MNITKYGHACLYVEESGVSLMIDPGSMSTIPALKKINAILVTHEHGDHLDIEKIKAIRVEHPEVQILTQVSVGKILDGETIANTVIYESETVSVGGVSIESLGHNHAIIYGDTSPCVNTGFFIAEKLFVPGDALDVIPTKPIALLALPTSGPWMRLGEAISYALQVKPDIAFPIHDGLYVEEVRRGMIPRMLTGHLEQAGIMFRDMPDNVPITFDV